MQAKTLTMPVDSTSSLDSAKKTLESINNFVSLGLRNLKVICTVNQRLEAKLLDDYQFASYQLAFCAAEISAASYFLDYCRDGSTNPNQRALALLFAGDTFQSVIERLKTASHDIGIDSEDLSTIENSTEAKALLLETQPKAVSALGAEIVDGTIGRLPSGLDDEKELVRESFSRFADEVVAPLAEKIHREDRDVPDEIIQAAAQLGCFGTCIPERFGGLQPDEKSDSVSMIVVTEELSRGSLGAAGSLITRPEIAARALLAGGTERQQQNWLP